MFAPMAEGVESSLGEGWLEQRGPPCVDCKQSQLALRCYVWPPCLTAWAVQEDAKIIALVSAYGARQWSRIANELPGRIGKQCRER